jgi:hypothetical protein
MTRGMSARDRCGVASRWSMAIAELSRVVLNQSLTGLELD